MNKNSSRAMRVLFLWLTFTQCALAETPLDAAIERAMKQAGVPGLAIAVIRPNRPDYVRGFGQRSVDSDTPVDAHTLFRMNSITKSMTATAVAMLAEAGKLDWEARIVDLYPEFRLADPWVTREAGFEDVFSHRVGVEATDWMEDVPGLTLEQAIHNLRHLPQVHRFRTHFLYDNFMYSAGGIAAGSRVGGWERLMEEYFFTALGMTESTVRFQDLLDANEIAPCHECELAHPPRGLDALSRPANIAAPHIYENGEARPTHWRWSVSTPSAAVWSTAHDMRNYLKLYLQGGELEGRKVLSTESIARLTAPRVSVDNLPSAWDQHSDEYARRSAQLRSGYALGWNVTTYEGRPMIHHDGSSIGYNSFVVILPRDGVAVAAVVNLREGGMDLVKPLAMDIVDRALGLAPVQWVDRAAAEFRERIKSAAIESDDVAYEAPALPQSAYVGRYRHPAYGDITVELGSNGKLVLAQGKTRWGVLHHRRHGVFELTWNGVRPRPTLVSVEVDVEGAVRGLNVEGQAFSAVD